MYSVILIKLSDQAAILSSEELEKILLVITSSFQFHFRLKPEGTKKLTKKSSGLMRITGRIPGKDVPNMFPICFLCVSYSSRSYKNFYRVHPELAGQGITVTKSSRAPP